VITFQCERGGSLIHAPTFAELATKRAIHDSIWHATPAGRCKEARQPVAPIQRAYRNTSAVGVTNGHGY